MLNILPSLRAQLLPALAALSIAGAALAPSSAQAQIPQTADFEDVELAPKVRFSFFKVSQDGTETEIDPSNATLEAGDQLKIDPFYNFPTATQDFRGLGSIGEISPSISESSIFFGHPPSGLDKWQVDTQLSTTGDAYRVHMTYDGAGSITTTMERTNILPAYPEGIPRLATGFIPAPPEFIWGDFNMVALPGPDNPGIVYPINIAARMVPDSEIAGGFIWDQPFDGTFTVVPVGENTNVAPGTPIGAAVFDNKIYFDMSTPDALDMNKIIFVDHPNIQPLGQEDEEYQTNFLLDGYALGLDEDNPQKQMGVTFTDNDILFTVSPNILSGGHVNFRIELDSRLTPFGPMEFSAIVPSGPSAVMDWDKYSDATPANAPRPVYLAAARVNQRGQ
jgi:hypothetical protein